MPVTRPPYPPQFRQQIVELHRAGRSIVEPARQFEPSEQAIRNGIKQADLYAGCRTDGLTTEERQELSRLRRENKQLRLRWLPIWGIGILAPNTERSMLSMAPRFFPPGNKGRWLGQLHSVESIAWLAAIVGCMLTLRVPHYQGLFVMAGAVTVLGRIVLMRATRQNILTAEKGFVFNAGIACTTP